MFTLNCKGRLVVYDQPVVMGIINCTPDSFYENSRINNLDQLVHLAEKMILDGASILDLGGQSTRPGSKIISQEEELDRVIPAIEKISRYFPEQIISVDTFYSHVAQEAVAVGASIINDISGGTLDPEMLSLVSNLKVPYVLMHMQGVPENMHKNPTYKDVVLDVFDFFSFTIKKLLDMGIEDIIIDPGFGFGKTAEHNFKLLKNLSFFQKLEKPILCGLSRKGTIYKTLKVSSNEALNGTTVLNTISIINGASILRVHDVKEAMEVIKLWQAYTK